MSSVRDTRWDKLKAEYRKWLVPELRAPDQPQIRALVALEAEGDRINEKLKTMQTLVDSHYTNIPYTKIKEEKKLEVEMIAYISKFHDKALEVLDK